MDVCECMCKPLCLCASTCMCMQVCASVSCAEVYQAIGVEGLDMHVRCESVHVYVRVYVCDLIHKGWGGGTYMYKLSPHNLSID